jgi:SAM-dependent methyltransferase
VDTADPVELTLDVRAASMFDVYDELLVPLCFRGYADDLAARLAGVAAASVLVVACGTGVDTGALAAVLPPTVAITASDLVPGMVERARRRAVARPVTWDLADALHLPYDDGSFDVVVCQFGAMFFPDKRQAFTEAARVLQPGGRFELAVWDCIERNEFGATVAAAMTETFPDDPPAFLERVPFAYCDPDVVRADLVAAGFTLPGGIEHVAHRARAASPEVVAGAFCGGTPLRDQLQSGGRDRLPAAMVGAAAALARRFGRFDLVGANAALVATAVKA